jgi:signal transduction histidine kinase
MISVLANEHEALSVSGRDSLRGVLADGNTLMQMLQNILDLWRLKQGEVSIDVQDVNLAEVIEEAIFNVRDTLQPDVVFEKRIPAALPKIRTDLGKLNQILFHLLDNAAKFTRRGRIALELGLEDGQLVCSVSDTGIGIAPDDQEQILDEFYRVDSSPDSRHRGAGLGLTLARGLIEKLGGSLSLRSEIGQGSCFSFALPVTIC